MTESQVESGAATTTRRAVLAGAGATGAVALLAACGTDEGDSSLSNGGGSTPDSNAGTTTAPTAGAPSGAGTRLGATGDIPEGGGKIFADRKVVVTQPASGTFKGFNATCTHQGCTVGSVENGMINCPCHGSQFSIEDGSVKKGPATQPLAEMTVTVNDDAVFLS